MRWKMTEPELTFICVCLLRRAQPFGRQQQLILRLPSEVPGKAHVRRIALSCQLFRSMWTIIRPHGQPPDLTS